MTIKYVVGDPTLTACQTLGIGHNRVGRSENDALATRLRSQFPTAYASYIRHCKANNQSAGDVFLWRDATPQLLFLAVRESGVGATRLRHVQSCMLTLARDYPLHSIESLAIAPLGEADNQADIHNLLEAYFRTHSLSVVVYTAYEAGIKADETLT